MVVEIEWGRSLGHMPRLFLLKLIETEVSVVNRLTNKPNTIAMAEQQRQKFALITGCTPGGIGYGAQYKLKSFD